MKIEQIKVPDKKRLKMSSLAYIADLAGCGYIRVIIPTFLLNQLFSTKFQFEQYYLNSYVRDLSLYKNALYVIFQRSATPRHLEYIKLTKSKISPLTRAKTIYEVDDLLFDIPAWNSAASYYVQHKANILEMLKTVHGVTVSSEKLKSVYSSYNNNISVIVNHLPKCVWGTPDFKIHEHKKPRIVYPCSSNHFNLSGAGGDISTVLGHFIRSTVDKYDWHFIGGLPFELKDLKNSGKLYQHP